MKRGKNLKDKYLSKENFLEALAAASDGKRDRSDVRYCLEHRDEIYESIIKLTSVSGRYVPKVAADSASGKVREILIPPFYPDQIMHHMVYQVCKPFVERGMLPWCCGSVKGRGPLCASKMLRSFLIHHPKQSRWAAKLDIRKYYPSIDHGKLKSELRKAIADPFILGILDSIVDSVPDPGIPIGNYTSQMFANFFLQGFDHFLKEGLKIPFAVRYADDIVITGSSKRNVKFYIQKIREELTKYSLDTHGDEHPFKVDKDGKGEPIDLCGFRHWRTKTDIRKRDFVRARRALLRYERNESPTISMAHRVISYNGFIKNSDSVKITKRFAKTIKKAKAQVSRFTRKEIERSSKYESSL